MSVSKQIQKIVATAYKSTFISITNVQSCLYPDDVHNTLRYFYYFYFSCVRNQWQVISRTTVADQSERILKLRNVICFSQPPLVQKDQRRKKD